jgi:hypothetical protein
MGVINMTSFATVEAMINLDDIWDHLDNKVNERARLAMDAEITKQFETIQQEVEGVCKQYLKELFMNWTMENGEGTDFHGDHWRSS